MVYCTKLSSIVATLAVSEEQGLICRYLPCIHINPGEEAGR